MIRIHMMKILLVFGGLLALAAAKPTKTTWLKRAFPAIYRAQRHTPDEASGNDLCNDGLAMSSAVKELWDKRTCIPGIPPIPVLLPGNEDVSAEVSRRVFGFNIFNDGLRDRAFCKLSKVETIQQLKHAMRHVNYGAFSVMYYYMVMSMPFIQNELPEQDAEDLRTLERLGLMSLDDEGAEWFLDITGMRGLHNYLLNQMGYEPANISSQLTPEEKCSILQELVARKLNDPSINEMMAHVKTWTGIDINDRERLNALLCDITGVSSLRELFDVIDEYGIIGSMYNQGYPLLASVTKLQISELENIVDMFSSNYINPYAYMNTDDTSLYDNEIPSYGYINRLRRMYDYGPPPPHARPPPGHGGPPHGQGGPPHGHGGPPHGHGGPPHGHGGPPPGHGGPPPGHGGPPPGHGGSQPQCGPLDILQPALDFLKALEASGLLDLSP